MTDNVELPPLKQMDTVEGLPLFLGDVDDIVSRAASEGLFRFYVLAGTKEETLTEQLPNGGTRTNKVESVPALFRVTCNVVGHVIQRVEKSEALALRQVPTAAYFELPKIPWEMIQKLDQFFRAAHDEYGTEAIALLTFDPRTDVDGKHVREGWGILIPDQTNSAAHCKYDPQSIIDDKDDEVIIVGTAHSHPGMDAFASHTDHGDQMGNDGVHITYGWRTGSNFSELHIELQMANQPFIVRDHSICLEEAPKLPASEEVKDWCEKVKVATSTTGTSRPHAFTPLGGTSGRTPVINRDPNKHYNLDGDSYELPKDAPDPDIFTVVVRLLASETTTCPLCGSAFRANALDRRRCWSCYAYLAVGDEKLEDIINLRIAREDAPVLDLYEATAKRPLRLWDRYEDNAGTIISDVIEVFEVGKAPAQA